MRTDHLLQIATLATPIPLFEYGKYLLHSGDPIEYIYVIVDGQVLMEDGKDEEILGVGSVIGLKEAKEISKKEVKNIK